MAACTTGCGAATHGTRQRPINPSKTQLHLLYTFAYLVQARQGDPQTTRPMDLLRRLEGRQEVRCTATKTFLLPRITNKAEEQV